MPARATCPLARQPAARPAQAAADRTPCPFLPCSASRRAAMAASLRQLAAAAVLFLAICLPQTSPQQLAGGSRPPLAQAGTQVSLPPDRRCAAAAAVQRRQAQGPSACWRTHPYFRRRVAPARHRAAARQGAARSCRWTCRHAQAPRAAAATPAAAAEAVAAAMSMARRSSCASASTRWRRSTASGCSGR